MPGTHVMCSHVLCNLFDINVDPYIMCLLVLYFEGQLEFCPSAAHIAVKHVVCSFNYLFWGTAAGVKIIYIFCRQVWTPVSLQERLFSQPLRIRITSSPLKPTTRQLLERLCRFNDNFNNNFISFFSHINSYICRS